MYLSHRGCLALLMLLFTLPLWSDDHTIRFTVQAEKVARENSPIKIPIRIPEALAKQTVVQLTDAAGNKLVGQITKPSLLPRTEPQGNGTLPVDFNFILPKLAEIGRASCRERV